MGFGGFLVELAVLISAFLRCPASPSTEYRMGTTPTCGLPERHRYNDIGASACAFRSLALVFVADFNGTHAHYTCFGYHTGLVQTCCRLIRTKTLWIVTQPRKHQTNKLNCGSYITHRHRQPLACTIASIRSVEHQIIGFGSCYWPRFIASSSLPLKRCDPS